MKKNTFTTIFCIALCAVMVFAVCACSPVTPDGPNNPDPDIDANKWWTTEGELAKDSEGKVQFKNVSIKLETVVAGDDKDAFNMIVNKFNREYNGKIIVTVTNTGAGEYEKTVASKITNNSNAPDLIMSHQKSHKNFADNKLIQPFDEAMEQSGIVIDKANYADGLAQYMSAGYANRMFSVPADAQSMAVFYNKELLASLNMQLPTNRAELLALCEAFKTKYETNPIAWETSGDYFGEYVYTSAILQNGGKLYDQSTYLTDWASNSANLTSIINASKSIRELFSAGYANFNESGSSALSTFLKGQRLFYFTDPWSMSDLVTKFAKEKGVSESKLMANTLGGTSFAGWFAMTDNAAKNNVYGDSHFFAMTKNVKDINKKAAILEFIRWFTSNAEIGADWAKAGHISASKIISANTAYSESAYVTNFVANFYGNIDNFRCIGSTPYYDLLIPSIKAIFSDTVDASSNHSDESDTSTIRQKQDAVNNNIGFFGN